MSAETFICQKCGVLRTRGDEPWRNGTCRDGSMAHGFDPMCLCDQMMDEQEARDRRDARLVLGIPCAIIAIAFAALWWFG